jgi:hypothetical protein
MRKHKLENEIQKLAKSVLAKFEEEHSFLSCYDKKIINAARIALYEKNFLKELDREISDMIGQKKAIALYHVFEEMVWLFYKKERRYLLLINHGYSWQKEYRFVSDATKESNEVLRLLRKLKRREKLESVMKWFMRTFSR